jgi:hypothetical protein
MIYDDWRDIPKDGPARIVAWRRKYTETSGAGYIVRRECVAYSIVGTVYGHIHTSAGDIRFWNSYSGARRHLARHILPHKYGERRDYRKIDLYDSQGRYLASTTWARDCQEALDHMPGAYSARYDKRSHP